MINAYAPTQLSKTAAGVIVLITGMMNGQFFSENTSLIPQYNPHRRLNHNAYEVKENSSTTGQLSTLVPFNSQNESDKQFLQTLSDFYADLAANQEPLGIEFSKILHDNLWDLYGS